MWTDPVAPRQYPVARQELEYRQMYFDHKSDLDGAIDTALRYGWKLLSRSYSSERGHGANLVRPRLNQAA